MASALTPRVATPEHRPTKYAQSQRLHFQAHLRLRRFSPSQAPNARWRKPDRAIPCRTLADGMTLFLSLRPGSANGRGRYQLIPGPPSIVPSPGPTAECFHQSLEASLVLATRPGVREEASLRPAISHFRRAHIPDRGL